MVQQQLDQVTDSFGLADCQELLTFYLYFDQSKTSRRDSVKIYLEDQRGPATALFDCQSFTEYICLSRPRRNEPSIILLVDTKRLETFAGL